MYFFFQLFNFSTCQLCNSSTLQLFNSSTFQLFNCSAFQFLNFEFTNFSIIQFLNFQFPNFSIIQFPNFPIIQFLNPKPSFRIPHPSISNSPAPSIQRFNFPSHRTSNCPIPKFLHTSEAASLPSIWTLKSPLRLAVAPSSQILRRRNLRPSGLRIIRFLYYEKFWVGVILLRLRKRLPPGVVRSHEPIEGNPPPPLQQKLRPTDDPLSSVSLSRACCSPRVTRNDNVSRLLSFQTVSAPLLPHPPRANPEKGFRLNSQFSARFPRCLHYDCSIGNFGARPRILRDPECLDRPDRGAILRTRTPTPRGSPRNDRIIPTGWQPGPAHPAPRAEFGIR